MNLPPDRQTRGAISSKGCRMLNIVGKGSLRKKTVHYKETPIVVTYVCQSFPHYWITGWEFLTLKSKSHAVTADTIRKHEEKRVGDVKDRCR